MKSIICPISFEKINRPVVRLTGLMMASMIALYLLTNNVLFILAITVDYAIRAFTHLPTSPFGWLAQQLVRLFNWPPYFMDKAPKIFAARVGWLFAFTTAVLAFISPTASLITGTTLMVFAILESVFNLCAGCLVYHYIVFPLFEAKVR
ncbi:MAG: DUF4395 domain-containing protein [Chloroflexota bacterium]